MIHGPSSVEIYKPSPSVELLANPKINVVNPTTIPNHNGQVFGVFIFFELSIGQSIMGLNIP